METLSSRKAVIRWLTEQFSAHAAVRRVYLFGSRARGDAAPRSDIDLAVEAPRIGRRDWLDLAAQAEEEAPTLCPVQIIRLDAASSALQRRILSEGALLYDRSESAAEPA